MEKVKKIVVLGSTGSVGVQSLDVLQQLSGFEVHALVANTSVDTLFAQCQQHSPRYAIMSDASSAQQLSARLHSVRSPVEVMAGDEAIVQLVAENEVDIVIAAIVGAAGLRSTFAAVKAGKRVLLANKEALVMAGDLLMSEVKKSGAELLPVDSEHNALFQAFPQSFLPGKSLPSEIEALTITASGGPFRTCPLKSLESVTPEQAVAHPTWSMGAKISVDSATMMNKALEIIEAYYLFSIPQNKLSAWIHPESIVHALVQYSDGSTLAQLGVPDMRTPITHCLSWPSRRTNHVRSLKLEDMRRLHFDEIDSKRYPCFSLGYAAISQGAFAVVALNAANEVAVSAFLNRQIAYLEIFSVIDYVLNKVNRCCLHNIDDVFAIDESSREMAKTKIKQLSKV